MDHSFVTAKGFHKSRPLPCRATQDRQVIVKSSDNIWSNEGGNGKPLQHSYSENTINHMKMQKYLTPEDEGPKSEGIQYTTREEQRAVTNSSNY